MTTIYDWVETYLDNVPHNIRPGADDHRFTGAAIRAKNNGWGPKQAAAVVSARSYANALNPQLIALIRLEEIVTRPPHTRTETTRGNASGCLTCPPHVTCQDPVTPANRCPPAHVPARMALLRELMTTTGMDEDERQHHMDVLIDHQRGAPPT